MSAAKKLNVYFLATWYPHRYDPMFGLFVQKHALTLKGSCSVSVLYVHADDRLTDRIFDITFSEEEGIATLRVYYRNSRNILIKMYRYLRSICIVYAEMKKRKGKPDLIHQHILTRFGILALYLKLFQGIPYVVTEHWSRYLPVNLPKGAYSGLFRRWLTKAVVKNAAAVTVVSEDLKNAMRALGLDNTYYVIPNSVDTNRFYPVLSKKNVPKKIVHVSCFDEPAKNIKGILRAAGELYRIRQDFILQLIGEGVDRKSVEAYAAEIGLSGTCVFFEGLLVGEELAKRMREADFLVLFSNYENLPCVIVESLACGVPVIATRVGGIPEHISPVLGILLDPKNEKGLLEAMNKMLDKSDSYDPEELRSYALAHFGNEAVGNTFNAIYKRALNQKT